jgi:hypothetical protein
MSKRPATPNSHLSVAAVLLFVKDCVVFSGVSP